MAVSTTNPVPTWRAASRVYTRRQGSPVELALLHITIDHLSGRCATAVLARTSKVCRSLCSPFEGYHLNAKATLIFACGIMWLINVDIQHQISF